MKLCKIFLTFIVYFLFQQANAQLGKNIKVKMNYTTGFRPFPRSNSTITLVKDISKFKVKTNLKDFIVKRFSIFPEHSKYQDFKNGIISESEYFEILKSHNIDSAKVYKGQLRSIIYCLIGQSLNDKRIIIFDQDGDFDFTNDFEYEFDYPNTSLFVNNNGFYDNTAVFKFIDDSIPTVKVIGEGIYDNIKYKKELLLKANPYNTNATYPSKKEQDFPVTISFEEHLEGFFLIDNKKYHLALNNLGIPYIGYGNKYYWRLMLRKDEETEFYRGKRGEGLYTSNDTIYIENKKYMVDSISIFGENVILKYLGEKSNKVIGFNQNEYINDFILKDINGEVINSKDLKKNYLLIDFWGTWCKPCLEMLPKIKDFYSKVDRSKIDLISIASENDMPISKFKEILKEKGIIWTQVLETNETKEKISELFKVSIYPTFFLIDRDRQIIMKGNSETEFNELISYLFKKTY